MIPLQDLHNRECDGSQHRICTCRRVWGWRGTIKEANGEEAIPPRVYVSRRVNVRRHVLPTQGQYKAHLVRRVPRVRCSWYSAHLNCGPVVPCDLRTILTKILARSAHILVCLVWPMCRTQLGLKLPSSPPKLPNNRIPWHEEVCNLLQSSQWRSGSPYPRPKLVKALLGRGPHPVSLGVTRINIHYNGLYLISKWAFFRSRRVFGEYFGEKTFYEPLRNLIKELVTVPEVPFYVYMFDYNCPTRGEFLPEKEVPIHYGSFHSLDIPFLFNSDSLSSSEVDVKVRKL